MDWLDIVSALYLLAFAIYIVFKFDNSAGYVVAEEEPNEEFLSVQRKIEKSIDGKVHFDIPKDMRFGEKSLIEVKVSSFDIEDNEIQDGVLGHYGYTSRRKIPIQPSMSVAIRSFDCEVQKFDSEIQVVTLTQPTSWKFSITPKSQPVVRLKVIVCILINVQGGKSNHKVLEKDFTIHVCKSLSFYRSIISKWVIFLGAFAAIVQFVMSQF